jgi:hypothetical protein
MKTVYILKSGKSVVVTMPEEQAFEIYNQWIKDNNSINADKIKIDKKRNNLLVEVTGILLSEIAAIQIAEEYNENRNKNYHSSDTI